MKNKTIKIMNEMKKLTELQREEVEGFCLNCMEEQNGDYDVFMDVYDYDFNPYEYEEEMNEIYDRVYNEWNEEI